MWSSNLLTMILLLIIQTVMINAGDIPENSFPSTSNQIKLRGFKAIDHYVTTSDGYILNLVEIQNPTIPNGFNFAKDTILFIHGIANNANFFTLNSNGTKPKNYSDLNVSLVNEEELHLSSDPSAKSLPFLASNFGHSVWMLNRRGSSQSQGNVHPDKQPFVNLTKESDKPLPLSARRYKRDTILKLLASTIGNKNADLGILQKDFNPRYWNFSLDEQARYDVPEIISYVLQQTNKEKLSIVGHSVGSAILLMSLTEYPDLANKISKSILFCPALYTTSARDVLASIAARLPLSSYIGPILPKPLMTSTLDSIELSCSNILTQSTICAPFIDFVFGTGGTQEDLSLKFLRITSDYDSSHCFDSLAQAAIKGKMHYYDYMNPQRNLIAYNQTSPPLYDVSRIKLRTISLWSGVTDGLVPYRTALAIGNDMSVPVEQVYLNESGLLFNHIGYSIHHNIARLVNIPALKRIES